MKNTRFLLFAILWLAACRQSPAQHYDSEGVSFRYPQGWTLRSDDMGNGHRVVSVGDDTGETGGMIMVTWYPVPEGCDCEEEARDFLRADTASLSENKDYKDLYTEGIAGANLNGYPAHGVSCRYMWFGSLNYRESYTLCHDARIISVTLTETLIGNDARDDRAFRLFKESFQIREN